MVSLQASTPSSSSLQHSNAGPPSDVTFRNAASVEHRIVQLGRQGRTDEALELYRHLERGHLFMEGTAAAASTSSATTTTTQRQKRRPPLTRIMPTVRHLNAAIDACARARPVRIQTCLELVQQTTLTPNVYTLGAMLSACARAGDVRTAKQWLRSAPFPTRGRGGKEESSRHQSSQVVVIPNAVCYQAAMTACARAGDLASALELLSEAQERQQQQQQEELASGSSSSSPSSPTLTVIAYNICMAAATKQADYQTAIRIFQTMPIKPDAVSYGTLLAACQAAGEWEKLLQYADEMRMAGWEWDGLALTSILQACQQLGLAQRALDTLQRMKLLVDGSISTRYRHTAGWERAGQRPPLTGPDAVAYRLAISACARGGAWRDGIRLLDELESSQLYHADVMAYTSAITGCEYVGEWAQAFRLLERMRKNNVEPNQVTFAAVLGACATACAREIVSANGSTAHSPDDSPTQKIGTSPMLIPQERALRLLRVMKKDPSVCNPNTQVYNAAIRVCAEAMDFTRALKVYQDMLEFRRTMDDPSEADQVRPNVITYGSLMTACERIGCSDGVNTVFRLLDADPDVMEPNEVVYGAAISACRKSGDHERVYSLFPEMIVRRKLSANVATFNTVLMSQTEAQAWDRVYTIFRTMHECSTVQPDRQTYHILIRALNSKGRRKPEEAEAFLRQMIRDGFHPDVDLYTATIAAYERAGQPRRALRLMESMRSSGYDFYEAPVLNTAFKRLVRLVSVVERGWHPPPDSSATGSVFLLDKHGDSVDDNNNGIRLSGNQHSIPLRLEDLLAPYKVLGLV